MASDDVKKKIKDVGERSRKKVSEAATVGAQRVRDYEVNPVRDDVADRLIDIAESLRGKDFDAKKDMAIERLENLSDRIRSIDFEAKRERVQKTVDDVDKFVKEHPIASLGIAVAVGFMFGSILKK